MWYFSLLITLSSVSWCLTKYLWMFSIVGFFLLIFFTWIIASNILESYKLLSHTFAIIKYLQFVIFNSRSYCLDEIIGIDAKASFASRPVSRLNRRYNKPGYITNEFWEKAIQFHGTFYGFKITNCLATVIGPKLNWETFDDRRYEIFKTKEKALNELPPTLSSIRGHLLMSHYFA